MKLVLQRVLRAEVKVREDIISSIGRGLLIFLGVQKGDTETDIENLVSKVINLRIFDNDQGKFDLSIKDVNGSVMLISNFTLCNDKKHGRRPSFFDAEVPEVAKRIYYKFADLLKKEISDVKTGAFGEHMHILTENDGPVTMIFETQKG